VTGGLNQTVDDTTDALGEGAPRVAPPAAEPVVGGVVEQAAPVLDGATETVTGQVEGATGQLEGAAGQLGDLTGGD
jgi:hypothetical protein